MAMLPVTIAVPPRESSINPLSAAVSPTRRVGYAFQMPKSGTLKYIQVNVNGFTTTGTLQVRLETINPISNLPSGTLAYTNGYGTMSITATGVYYFPINGGTGVTVAKGDEVVAVWTTTDTLSITMEYYDGHTIPGAQATSQCP